jgi:hypothetical protein
MIVPEMSQANKTENILERLIAPSNRYIVAKVGALSVTFPDVLVSEIIILDRNAILALPFYETVIIGVTHHQANVMPLLLLRLLIGEQRILITESLTVVRLSKIAEDFNGQNLSGVGIVVDRVIGSLTVDEYKDLHADASAPEFPSLGVTSFADNSTKKINQTVANIKENEYTPIEIILLNTPAHIWRPQRWHISS